MTKNESNEKLFAEIQRMSEKIDTLRINVPNPTSSDDAKRVSEIQSRLDSVELRLSKLFDMLVRENQYGQEKLTSQGQKVRRNYSDFIRGSVMSIQNPQVNK